ncbi:hypothetical protein EZ456_00985 [Pedobacter psychrodurus]|uniref:Putative amidase domain-containing protein n=1 Tax=Pedobacter psychrodurus TaxID=2530456 RepID=A0A4R0Q8U1_9SPHI|nr:amidase domain-containing protein [Pedobacter psychrodurus]TCD29622.1 hypothetical protein EZ456_00985 [Pedobacter psychrodurus]
MRRIFFYMVSISICIFFASCAKRKTLKMEVDITDSLSSVKKMKTAIEVNYYESDRSTVKYKNPAAIAYAKKYAALSDNVCGIYNNNPSANLSDCAHFIAHCLKSGGIEIKAQQPNLKICTEGLCYRVQELTSALKKLSQQYSNVSEIEIEDAIIGDYGFFKIPIVRPTHAFMICQPAANTDDIKIYAHTANRSCTTPEPKWYQFFDVAYRITDGN